MNFLDEMQDKLSQFEKNKKEIRPLLLKIEIQLKILKKKVFKIIEEIGKKKSASIINIFVGYLHRIINNQVYITTDKLIEISKKLTDNEEIKLLLSEIEIQLALLKKKVFFSIESLGMSNSASIIDIDISYLYNIINNKVNITIDKLINISKKLINN